MRDGYYDVPLAGDKGFAKISVGRYDLISKHNWCLTGKGYPTTRTKGKLVKLHRMILGLTDPKIQTDHINRDALDSRDENLRKCDNGRNQRNSIGLPYKTSKYCGVYWNKRIKKWHTQINFNGKQEHLGFFTEEVEAAQTYNQRALELDPEFFKLNKC